MEDEKNMKKTALLLLALLVITTIAFQTNPVSAVSSGYERYVDDECEVYVEYFPIVPFDPTYPTASEEFAIKFYVSQKDWWEPILVHVWPSAFSVSVYFRDDTCGDINYVTWKRWYPVSVEQRGWKVSWSLTGGYGPVSIGATVSTPDSSFTADYTKYPVDDGTYMHLSHLVVDYNDNWLWGSTYAEGAGSMGVPNDAAQPHEGHHVLIWVIFDLYWHVVSDPPTRRKTIGFCIGDDVPADTDCRLTVEQGDTSSSVDTGSGGYGGGGCPTLFVWDGSQYVEEALLDIHAESDVTLQHIIGETLVPDKNSYKLSLRELDEFTSHMDYVKLYVVGSDGEMHETHLTKAAHSELGDIKEMLLHDDDARVDLIPEQTIDLRFTVPNIDEVAYFTFEINGYNMKTPIDGPI